MKFAALSGWCLTSKLTGPKQRDGICASVFACTNTGTLCRVRLSDLLGVTYQRLQTTRIKEEALVLVNFPSFAALALVSDWIGNYHWKLFCGLSLVVTNKCY